MMMMILVWKDVVENTCGVISRVRLSGLES